MEVPEGERDDRVAALLENAVNTHEGVDSSFRVRDGFQQIHRILSVPIFCLFWIISVDSECDVPQRSKNIILIYSRRFLESKI